MPHIETTIDIVLRRTSRKWLGIVQIDGREVYRTCNYHDTKEGALERADQWFKESMQVGNLKELFKQILGTSNPSLQGAGHLVDRTLQGVVQSPNSGGAK